MSGLKKIIIIHRALRPRNITIIPRANLQSKPAKEKLGAVETSIAMGILFLSVLGPSGWILSHLEDYKTKK